MAERPIIYVDFDDVLCETAQCLIAIAQREFGWKGSFSDLHSFDLGISLGLGTSEVEILMRRAHAPETIMGFEPVAGAIDGLRRLHVARCKIVVVTGRPVDTREASQAWLKHHGISFANLVFADKYGRARRFQGDGILSLDELAALPFCLAVEDAPDAVTFFLQRTKVPLILFDRPWNRAVTPHPGRVRRCSTWAEITREALRLLESE